MTCKKSCTNPTRGADAIVYHPGASIGYFAAREIKVPGILAATMSSPARALGEMIRSELGGERSVDIIQQTVGETQ